MKVKTSELTGPALDWAVAKCEWPEASINVKLGFPYLVFGRFNPTANWAQIGPIIEREKIYLNCLRKGDNLRAEVWEAWPYNSSRYVQQGPTPQIAACRCYVDSKLGDEVKIPEELTSHIFIEEIITHPNTGGGIPVEYLRLKNGMVIGISEDCVCLYESWESLEQGGMAAAWMYFDSANEETPLQQQPPLE